MKISRKKFRAFLYPLVATWNRAHTVLKKAGNFPAKTAGRWSQKKRARTRSRLHCNKKSGEIFHLLRVVCRVWQVFFVRTV